MRPISTRSTAFARASLAGAAVFALVTAACGSDSASNTSAADTQATAAVTTAPTTTAVAETTVVASTDVAATAAGSDTTDAGATTEAPPVTEPATTEATTPAAVFEGDLVGTFSVDPAQCAGGAVTAGSYFQMIQLGGTPEAGPFIPNADSSCADPNFTALAAGTDGGLKTGQWQPAPDPAFDAAGNGLVASIIEPVTFFGVKFATGTDPSGAMPSIVATGGDLSGDLSAFTAYYGGASFNQGAPKPDGSGAAPTGTIDAATGAYVLDWTSLIVGGSFDGFTGVWHLEGTFTKA